MDRVHKDARTAETIQPSAGRNAAWRSRWSRLGLALAGPRPALWALLLGLAALDGVWLMWLPIAVEPRGFCVLGAVTVVLLAAAAFWTLVKPEITLRSMALATAYLAAFTAAATVLHYLGATLDRPLVDAGLAHAETALGFDWRAHVAFLDAHPGLARALALAYHSSAAQIGLVVITLSAVRRTARLWRFVELFVMTLMVVVAVSTLFPAEGPYAFYAGVKSATSTLETAGATWHLQPLAELRGGAATGLALSELRGLATFPSFHVCLALITAWALAPVPIIGPLAVLLNGAVVVATIGAGGHYLPDVLAGGAIGGFMLAYPWAKAALGALGRRSPSHRPGPPNRSDASAAHARISRPGSARAPRVPPQPGDART